jgi:hypothetical protein
MQQITHKILMHPKQLAEGRVIGSGQVEGACKSMIGKRLKQTSARWDDGRLNEMAVLCSVHYYPGKPNFVDENRERNAVERAVHPVFIHNFRLAKIVAPKTTRT